MSEPTIRPTRAWQVVAAAAVGFAGTWLALTWWQGSGHSLPIPGAVSWVSTLVVAAGVAYLALRTRRALADDPTSLDPQQAVTRLLLGKTSLLGGALLGGGYAAVVVLALPALPAQLAIERVVHGGIATVVAALWAVLGRWLENVCRLPPSTGDKDPDTPAR